MQFKNILVLAPHTDDGELGAGGFISRLIEEGAKITYVALSTAEASVPEHLPRNILKKEVRIATKKLGILSENLIILDYEVRKLNYSRQEILEDFIKIRNKSNYDLILLPSLKDLHQDHSTVAQEGLRAFKNSTILGYELIWNNLSFDTTSFVKLEKKHIDAKYNALKKYKSQKDRQYIEKEFIYSLAKTRGVQIGADFAESFEVLRWVIN